MAANFHTMAAGNVSTARLTSNMSIGFSPAAYGLLTPETLLAFCESKIRGIDEQVQRAFAGQTKRNRLSTALSDLASTLGDHKEVGKDDATGKATIRAAYEKAIGEAGPDTELGKKLSGELASFNHTSTEKDKAEVSADEMKNFSDTVGRFQSDVNRDGELEMIQLQSLMSQRQQAIQMCTNMVAGLGQSSQQVAANIGK